MKLTYQTENWFDALIDVERHWPAHWEEVALDRERIKLAPNYEEYAAIARAGLLHLTTARHDNELVGYVVAVIKPHLHYRDDLYGYWDLYYLAPAHRRWTNGAAMFREAVRAMNEKGVVKHIAGTKRSKDMSAMFKRLGWRETEVVFTLYTGTK